MNLGILIRRGTILAVGMMPIIVCAQSPTAREFVVAATRTVAPECSRSPDPGATGSLSEQRKFWESMQSCLAARSATERIIALRDGADAQISEARTAFQTQELQKEIAENLADVQNQQDFLGWSWGVGFGFGLAADDRVEEAEVIDGVVRSKKDTTEQARLFLEYHWYPEAWQKTLGKRDASDSIVRAQGPFVAVASRDDKVLSGVGVGWSIGFRDKDASEGFGISIGAMLDNDVNVLADGFKDGEPLPEGESDIRLLNKARVSYVVFFTRTF